MKAIVIGGGASGLVRAICLAKMHYNVTILEKNKECGKKILATGNGRCNYFNANIDSKYYLSSKEDEIDKFINQENVNKVLDFMASIGVVPKIKNGLYYPYSNTATTIRNMLLLAVKNNTIKVLTDVKITNISNENKFKITTNLGVLESDILVLATGSNAGLKTSDQLIYNYLEKIGHKIIPLKPALVPLTSANIICKNWDGIRCNAKVSLYQNNLFLKEEIGEVQLTKYGISGICIMNLSGLITKNNYLLINFLPDIINPKEYIFKRFDLFKNNSIVEMLESLLNYKLLYAILYYLKIDVNSRWNELKPSQQDEIINCLTSFKLEINGTLDLAMAQTKRGGVSLEEVTATCESKIIPKLYILGELLDITGYCGGYNLGFAWISGLVIK